MFQDKALSAANGPIQFEAALGKGCNAGLGYLGGSLRARRYAAIYFVAYLTPYRLADTYNLFNALHFAKRRDACCAAPI